MGQVQIGVDDNNVPIFRDEPEPPPPPPKKKPAPSPTMLDKAKGFFGIKKSDRRKAADEAANYDEKVAKLAKGGRVRDGKAQRGKTKGRQC